MEKAEGSYKGAKECELTEEKKSVSVRLDGGKKSESEGWERAVV